MPIAIRSSNFLSVFSAVRCSNVVAPRFRGIVESRSGERYDTGLGGFAAATGSCGASEHGRHARGYSDSRTPAGMRVNIKNHDCDDWRTGWLLLMV